MQYRFSQTYEQADFVAFMAAYIARSMNNKGSYRLMRILSLLGGGFMIFGGVVNVAVSVYVFLQEGSFPSFGYWLPPAIIILIGLLILFSKDTKQSGKLLWRSYKNKGKPVTFLFGPADFKVHDVSGDARYEYSVIQDIYEDAEHYFLFIGTKEAHILLKSGAERKNDGFDEFIAEKTGLDVHVVRRK